MDSKFKVFRKCQFYFNEFQIQSILRISTTDVQFKYANRIQLINSEDHVIKEIFYYQANVDYDFNSKTQNYLHGLAFFIVTRKQQRQNLLK